MSTRSMIYIEYFNTYVYKFTGIYCHFDGYPEYVGKILSKFYSSTEKVENLLKKGDISYFDEDGSVKAFEDNQDFLNTRYFKDENDFPKFIDYHYKWNTIENEWYVSEYDKRNWKKLIDVLK